MFFQLLLVFLLLPVHDFINTAVDYTKIREMFNCDDHCYFEESEINSRTLSNWPSGDCFAVCGVITLNQHTDVSPEKLKSTFKKLNTLYGGIQIQNTNFTSLNFFPKFYFPCSKIGIIISNNSKLENFKAMSQISMQLFKGCSIQVSAFPGSDFGSFCERFNTMEDYEIVKENLECGCDGGNINFENFDVYKNCEKVIGKLTVSDLKDQIPNFSNLFNLHGNLEVKNTNLKNISFLENLQEIRVEAGEELNLNIQNNTKMKKLGLGAFLKISKINNTPVTLNFQNLHPDFCIAPLEMYIFLDAGATFTHLEAHFCNGYMWTSDQPELCGFYDMAELNTNCVYIFGDLSIGSGDEKHVGKLENVTHVYGSVTVKNTSLENLDYFKNLVKVVNLDRSKPAMQFLSNKKLQNLQLPRITISAPYQVITPRSLDSPSNPPSPPPYPPSPQSHIQDFVTSGNNTILITDNHPNFFEKDQDCLALQLYTKTNISYNGKPCTTKLSDLNITVTTTKATTTTTKPTTESPVTDNSDNVDDYDYEDFKKIELFWLDTGNPLSAVIGFVINIFHLMVLSQKELRTNFIYILMIGICLSDIIYVLTFLKKYPIHWIWPSDTDNCYQDSLISIFLSFLEIPIQQITRKTSSILAFLMALFRTLSVMFPTSDMLITVSKPICALSLIIGVFLGVGVFDLRPHYLCEINGGLEKCQKTNSTINRITINCPVSFYFTNNTTTIIDGYFTITLSVLYLLITIVLLYQLRIAKNRRKSLKSDKSESNTAMLITVMTITFFLSALLNGLIFATEIFRSDWPLWNNLKNQSQVFLWTFLTINSSVHCLICFFMSSQYRSVARKLFWKKEKESSIIGVASVTLVKTNMSSGTTR